MTESISVIITCHNLEHYISEAIESVLAQDCEREFEIIVVDDASTDGSGDVIKRYPRIRYLEIPRNVGVLLATIHGLRAATGGLIFFLDGDDTWHPEKLRLCVQQFDADRRLGFVTHDFSYMDADGRELEQVSRPSQVFGNTVIRGSAVRQGILNNGDYVWLGSAYAVRGQLVDTAAFCAWAEQLADPGNTYQDWPLAFWAASQSSVGLLYLPQKLFKYRMHGANYSGDATDVQKAIRNVTRTLNTMKAMRDIALNHAIPSSEMEETYQKLEFYEYMVSLYSGRRVEALRKFLAVQRYVFFSHLHPLKEWARFVGIQSLGAKRFVRLLS